MGLCKLVSRLAAGYRATEQVNKRKRRTTETWAPALFQDALPASTVDTHRHALREHSSAYVSTFVSGSPHRLCKLAPQIENGDGKNCFTPQIGPRDALSPPAEEKQ